MKILIAIIGVLFSFGVFAQDIPNNNVFIEVGAPYSLVSVNYEYLLTDDINIKYAIRAGLALDMSNPLGSIIAPLSLSLLKNLKGNNYLELRLALRNELYRKLTTHAESSGMGNPNPTYNTYEEVEYIYGVYPSIGVGYRYQPQSKGVFLSCLVHIIGLQPETTENIWYNKISVGAGYAF